MKSPFIGKAEITGISDDHMIQYLHIQQLGSLLDTAGQLFVGRTGAQSS